MRKLVAFLTVSISLLAACATSPVAYYASQPRCAASQPDPVITNRCLEIPQVRDYVEQARNQVLDAWELPRRTAANQIVSLTFRLRSDGSIQCVSLSQDPYEPLAKSVVSAIQSATPFAPMPSEANCLEELPIVASFSNPLSKESIGESAR